MKALITGGAGFIGLNLISFIQQLGSHEISVLDNFSSGKKGYLKPFGVTVFEADIRDVASVRKAVRGHDVIVHLAADTRVIDSVQNPTYNFEVNVIGTFHLLQSAKEAGVSRFVFASTGGAILGDVVPPVHEDMVPMPISPYGASKLCGEGYCSAFSGSFGMRTTSLRFSNVYGPRSYHKGSAVAHFFKQILSEKPLIVYGDGSQTRDFIYIEDLCEAVWNAMCFDNVSGVYQLGSGIELSVNELVENIKEVVGSGYQVEVRYEDFRAGEIMHNYARIEKARKELKFQAKTELLEGLHKTWQWFLNAPQP